MLLNSQTRLIITVTTLALFVSVFLTGCVKRTDISCIVFGIIDHTVEDIDVISDTLARSMDNHNEKFRGLCG